MIVFVTITVTQAEQWCCIACFLFSFSNVTLYQPCHILSGGFWQKIPTWTDNIDTIRKNTETLIDASKEVGLEINVDKTKYMLLSHRQTNCVKIEKKLLKTWHGSNIWEQKYQTKIWFREEIKRWLNSGNASYHSVRNLLSSHLLPKNVKKTGTYRPIILPVVLYRCEIWSLTLRE
jgi:hypothetical protein